MIIIIIVFIEGADQLRGYHAADLRLSFHMDTKKLVFSRHGSQRLTLYQLVCLCQLKLFTLHCLVVAYFFLTCDSITVMTLSFWTDRSRQTVQIQIRLLLEEQSDQGLQCLLVHWHVFD